MVLSSDDDNLTRGAEGCPRASLIGHVAGGGRAGRAGEGVGFGGGGVAGSWWLHTGPQAHVDWT